MTRRHSSLTFFSAAAALLHCSSHHHRCEAFTLPSSSVVVGQVKASNVNVGHHNTGILHAQRDDDSNTNSKQQTVLFSDETLAEANDALASVGWVNAVPIQGEGEMTSDDPFVMVSWFVSCGAASLGVSRW
jgi:hypothetical protein